MTGAQVGLGLCFLGTTGDTRSGELVRATRATPSDTGLTLRLPASMTKSCRERTLQVRREVVDSLSALRAAATHPHPASTVSALPPAGR